MASSSVSVYVNGNHIRTYGGNRSDVRNLASMYRQLSKEQFMEKHPHVLIKTQADIQISTKYNKK